MPTPALPKTFFFNSDYISMARAASDYRRLLGHLGCLTTSPDDADVVILQGSIDYVAAVRRLLPSAGHKHCVAFLVWEADRLSETDTQGIAAAGYDAIWTPSWYSARSLCAAHPHVRWLPHVVRAPQAPSAAAVAQLDEALGPRGHCEMLQIGRAIDPRKGFDEAARAVRAVAYGRQGLTLIQKMTEQLPTGSPELVVRRHGCVVEVGGLADDDLMAALYARCHFVLSSHHAEGWGLTLSEGMAAGRPGIAPAYSGNLAFMAPTSSLLLPGTEEAVHKHHASKAFYAPMRWHYTLPGQLEQAIERAYAMVGTKAYAAMSEHAHRMRRSYDERHVQAILRSLLVAVVVAAAGQHGPRRAQAHSFPAQGSC